MTPQATKDRRFQAYARALVLHHSLLSESKEDTPDFEFVEDHMSSMWLKLNEEQREAVRGISSDLGWLRREYAPPPKGRHRVDVTREEMEEFQKLCETEDHSQLLRLARICAPALDNGLIALCRARSYLGLGLREVSVPFLKATIELSAHRSEACRAAFVMLIHVNPSVAFQKTVEILDTPDMFPPVVVAYAFRYFVDFLGGDPAAVSREKVVEELGKATERLSNEPTPYPDRVKFYALAGPLLMSLGLIDDGVRYLEEGLKLDPEDADLLGWLGEGMWGKDRSRAVDYFKRSILGQTRLVRPWLYLAHHFLLERDFERAQAYAAQAADMVRDNYGLAFALEIMAISMSEIGEKPKIVLGMLRHAANLAPDNKRIAYNLRSFERFIDSKSGAAAWDTEEDAADFETRERWHASDDISEKMLFAR